MAGKVRTVTNLVAEVRSQLDEDNRDSIKDNEDILPALNRAQDYAANILSRHYEAPLLTNKTVSTTPGTDSYDIPTDAFEERLEKVEVLVSGQYQELKRVDYRNIGAYENQVSAVIPWYYAVVGDKFQLIPGPSTAYPIRVWYLKDPLPLVKDSGRITKVEATSNFILVNSVGEDLTTESDELDSYVNIVDGKNGAIKASMQIKNIVDNKITFKSTPTRTEVLGATIQSDLSALTDSVVISPDDYISVVSGTCVPFFKKPFSNFLVQYAVAELRRKLGGDVNMELQTLKDLEEQVERSWVGRESTLRVRKSNRNWLSFIRRYN